MQLDRVLILPAAFILRRSNVSLKDQLYPDAMPSLFLSLALTFPLLILTVG